MLDPKGLEAAELELSEVLKDWHYVMPTDGMDRVIRTYISASIPADSGLIERLKEESLLRVSEKHNLMAVYEDDERVLKDLCSVAAAALRSQAQRIGELEDDVVEFMQRLDAQWFLEQNWFPKTVAEGSDLSSRARVALSKEGNGNV